MNWGKLLLKTLGPTRPSTNGFLIFWSAPCWLFKPPFAQILLKIFLVHCFSNLFSHFLDLFTSQFFEFFFSLYDFFRSILFLDRWFYLVLLILIVFKSLKAFRITIQYIVRCSLRMLCYVWNRSSRHYWWLIIYLPLLLVIVIWHHVLIFLVRLGTILGREYFDILFVNPSYHSRIPLIVQIIIFIDGALHYFDFRLFLLRFMLMTQFSCDTLGL